MTITRIISGGQTGADQAGLAAAKELGLATGGWMPAGWRTDEGSRPDFQELYGMIEDSFRGYASRTARNVHYADATLIFGNKDSPGCRLTENLAFESGKDICWIGWQSGAPVPNVEFFQNWLKKPNREIKTLNVAGNRERTNPGIFLACKTFLIAALKDQ